ncbi:MAG: HD domain-containing protein [Clostridia bacterium]|nr:HD domain-containing protein [Clostridia bacterium]
MIITGYGICAVISVLVTMIMALRSYDHIDSYDWTITILLPFLIIAYWLKAQVSEEEASLVLFVFIELMTSLLLAVVLFSMLHGIGIRVRLWTKAIVYGAIGLTLFPIGRIFANRVGTGSVEITDTGDGYVSRMTGIFNAFEHFPYLLAAIIFITCIIALILSGKKKISRRSVLGYLAFIGIWIAMYTVEAAGKTELSYLPFLYVLTQFLLMASYDQMRTHDISNLITENQKDHAVRSYVAIGLNGRFLGANEKSYDFFPELRNRKAETRFTEDSELGRRFARIIRNYTENGIGTGSFPFGNQTLAYRISGFSVRKGGAVRGYLIDIRDATEEKKNLELLTDYNDRLNREVAEKTRNIEAMQEKLVLSMADMVENRDGNTGGHVRRTSDIVAILVRTITENNLFPLDEALARDIIRTAPMHDLGKVSIDSGILNKPARLTPEEYDIMKTHSTISGQMVKILLDGVEEDRLVETAYRLARHHHERWDGKGYPDGLVGEMIPLEARIMAVADVYDALVSKRVYKEPMSYEKAARIMCEGMGTQFDPNMRNAFLCCRKELEDYYSVVNEAV